jgi:hypothetical protein
MRRMRSAVARSGGLALVLALLVQGPAPAGALAGASVECGDVQWVYVELNIQATDLTAIVPCRIEGDPGAWTIQLVRPASTRSGPGELPYPEELIGSASGTGPVSGIVVDVTDPEWRWRLIDTADAGLDVRLSWTGGSWEFPPGVYLRVMTDAGRSNGGTDFGIPGTYPPYIGPGMVIRPPDPIYPELGRLLHPALSPSKFARRGAMRTKVTVPFLVGPMGNVNVVAAINYVPKSNPRRLVKVYTGRTPIDRSVAPGTPVTVRARLTSAGLQLAKRLGARKLAKSLESTGRVDFTSKTLFRGGLIEYVWVPVGTSFANDQLERGWPRAQTCPPFPGMPTGYAIYSAIGSVYGSSTCTRGEPLVPWPMY